MAKVIVVLRADCDIGAAVASSLGQKPSYKVKAAGISFSEKHTQTLKSSNVEIIDCDFKSVQVLKDILMGAEGCFVVTKSNFSNPQFVEEEIEQGQNIADACKEARVPHVIFNTQLHPFKTAGISARHLVAKAEIEGYMRQIGLPMTCILIPPLYEEFLCELRPRGECGSYHIDIPVGMQPFFMISVEDIGEIVSCIFTKKDLTLNKTLSVCGDKQSIKEMAQSLSKHLHPTRFQQYQITIPQYQQQHSREPFAMDYGNMFDFYNRVDQRYNLQETKSMYHDTKSFDEWVYRNSDMLRRAFP